MMSFFFNIATPENGYKTQYPFRYTEGNIGDLVYLVIYDEVNDSYRVVMDEIVDVYDHAVNYQGSLKDSALCGYYIEKYNPGRSVSFGTEIFKTEKEAHAFKKHIEENWLDDQ